MYLTVTPKTSEVGNGTGRVRSGTLNELKREFVC